MQLAGYVHGRALQEWKLRRQSEHNYLPVSRGYFTNLFGP